MKKEICPECEKGFLQIKKVPYYLYGEKIGDFEGEVCTKCKAEFFNEGQEEQIEKEVKELGLLGLETETKIRQTGSSMSITLPKKIMQFLDVHKGKEVVIIPVDKHTLKVKI